MFIRPIHACYTIAYIKPFILQAASAVEIL
nr:MAG TPA: hypothetical protein [Myoviridae sp. ct3tv2]